MTRNQIRQRLDELHKIAMPTEDAKFLDDMWFQLAYSHETLTTEQEARFNDICNRHGDDGSLPA